MKVPFGKFCFGFIALIFFTITANAAIAQGPPADPTERAKIVQPDLVDRLNRGEATVDIIVLLKGYKEYVGKIKADNPAEMKILQAEIRRNQNAVLARLNPGNFTPRHVFENILGFSGTVNRAAFEALVSMPEVESIEEDQIAEAQLAQGIPLMNGTQVRSSYSGAGVSIAIVDTGIDYTHSMLGGAAFPNSKVIGGWDFGDNDSNPMDCYGHGTSVAGIAAGTLATGPGDYIGGVAYNAKLYALKIVSGCGSSAYYSTIAAAWSWAVTHKNDNPANPILVINTSFGGGQYSSACDGSQSALAAAANTAVNNGITLFSSSGNNAYTNAISAPACVTNSISVGAVYDANIGSRYWSVCTDLVTAPDKVTCYSNSANFLDILAPSNDAYTTAVGGGYTSSFGGTSAASPYAAGAAAVLQSYNKSVTGQFYTPANLKARLINTGNPITDSKNGITKPRVNILTDIYGDWHGWLCNVDYDPPSCWDSSTDTCDGNNSNAYVCSGGSKTCNDVANFEHHIDQWYYEWDTWDYRTVICNSHNLTVSKAGTGSGTVTSSPAGISCGTDCSEPYSHGTTITLTASPSAGSVFSGWSGGGCSGTGTCVINLNDDITVTATFTAVTYYGDWHSWLCNDDYDPPSCWNSSTDTCDGNNQNAYVCPSGVSKNCNDVANFQHHIDQWYYEWDTWDYRSVSCVP